MPLVINRFAFLLSEKERKENKSISYADIFQETGIARSTLSKWATNKVRKYDADTIEKLCSFLGCRPGDLIILVEE
jgi:DNA-binding Xre family transcriptional regulator